MGLYVLLFASVFAHVIAASPGMVEASDVETIDAEQKKLAEYVLSGYRHGRSLLRTGEFRYSGIRMRKSAARGIDRTTEIQGFMVFDFERNWLRFDREEPIGVFERKGAKRTGRKGQAFFLAICMPVAKRRHALATDVSP